MPILDPNEDESEKDFVCRCVSDALMKGEFSNESQRAAACKTAWAKSDHRKKPKKKPKDSE